VLERLSDADMTNVISRAVVRISPDAPQSDNGMHTHLDDAMQTSSPSRIDDVHEFSELDYPTLSSPTLASSQPPDAGPEATSLQATELPTLGPHFPAFPQLTTRVMATIVSLATGDARTALSLLELVLSSPQNVDENTLLDSLRRSVSTSYDRTGDSRYDQISALHKSVRGSDGSAAMYWLARMLTAGEVRSITRINAADTPLMAHIR
jgi:putative ATPase